MKCWWFRLETWVIWLKQHGFNHVGDLTETKRVSPCNVAEKNTYFSHMFGGFNWKKHDFTWILPCFSWEISLPLERLKWLSPLAIKRSWETIYWGGFWRATWIYQSLDVCICIYTVCVLQTSNKHMTIDDLNFNSTNPVQAGKHWGIFTDCPVIGSLPRLLKSTWTVSNTVMLVKHRRGFAIRPSAIWPFLTGGCSTIDPIRLV